MHEQLLRVMNTACYTAIHTSSHPLPLAKLRKNHAHHCLRFNGLAQHMRFMVSTPELFLHLLLAPFNVICWSLSRSNRWLGRGASMDTTNCSHAVLKQLKGH